jgi:hypothetical protein
MSAGHVAGACGPCFCVKEVLAAGERTIRQACLSMGVTLTTDRTECLLSFVVYSLRVFLLLVLPVQCWTVAEVRDRPGGKLYAVGRALYVTPRSHPTAEQQQQ